MGLKVIDAITPKDTGLIRGKDLCSAQIAKAPQRDRPIARK